MYNISFLWCGHSSKLGRGCTGKINIEWTTRAMTKHLQSFNIVIKNFSDPLKHNKIQSPSSNNLGYTSWAICSNFDTYQNSARSCCVWLRKLDWLNPKVYYVNCKLLELCICIIILFKYLNLNIINMCLVLMM